jgi:hypothetical protein
MQAVIIAHTTDASQLETIKAFFKALKIKFEIGKESSYNHEFVAKIQESREQYKKGQYKVIKTKNLWK